MKITRASDAVKIKITDFEGPLDLLLHLIREAKLDIKTVRLSAVTAQYLSILSDLDQLDMNLASEFVEVAATLIEIKARNILPRAVAEDPEDLEQRLIAQIEEYKLLKEASERLKPLENVNRYYKEPAKLKSDYRYVLDNLSMDGLMAAFSKLLFRVERSAAPPTKTQIKLDRFTVADKISDIRGLLSCLDNLNFTELFNGDYTKSEVINTFQAILELLKIQEISVKQEKHYGEISITRGECYGQHQTTEPVEELGYAIADQLEYNIDDSVTTDAVDA
jgi:segregation and condensation protein A